jgi:hypothetical protein
MKKSNLILFIFVMFCSRTFSQDVIRLQSCNNNLIQKQVDSLKNLYSHDGFMLLKEASITMESAFEMPVVMPLNQGSWYQFVFIGDYTSKLYEVRMYDWDGNVISYSYIPQFSEFHMMKPVQVNNDKKKNLCGYVMLFKKTGNAQPNP